MTSLRSDSGRLGSAARGEQHRCRPVDPDLSHDLGLVNALEPAGADVARVVDRYVDPTELGAGRGHHRLRRAWFGEVTGSPVGLATLLSDPKRQLVEGLLTATHEREPRGVCSARRSARAGPMPRPAPVIRIGAFSRCTNSP